MKIFTLVAVLCSTLLTFAALAQDNAWPKTATTPEGAVVKLYEWQPESFADNTLQAHAAISVLEQGKTDPVFGVAWLKATTVNNGQQVQVQSIYVTNIKLPGETNDDKLESLAKTLEGQVPSWNLAFSQSELQVSLDLNKQQNNLSQQINNAPPKIIYSTTPSILVLIDGTPKLQRNDDWNVEAVVNTPFVIVKTNGRYYLHGGKHWYTATAVTGDYKMVTDVPSNLEKIESAIKDAGKNNEEGKETDANTIYNIIVSTEPAELIQSRGEANFAAVESTGLLYVSNSENDIFMDINSQQYYVLLSGRWYQSKTLSGNWQYVASDKLPADFARIPKGSPKDNVLASVAGTPQALDAVTDAQVPQTAKVERSKVHADVDYDGDPEFENIDGTDMAYATNSPVSVIRWRGRYYCVDDGVWFESRSAVGPWSVCLVRPYAVSLIPPRYPVYYMKYVYIYDVTPDFVYMGYTPGYLNAYVYGPTVVYGTGYYYRPWYGRYYYPRPYTWGFGVRYNPWYGWGFGFGFGYDWFNMSIGFGNPYGWGYWGCGGWWGPRVYRPVYYGSPYHYRGGYYGYNSYNVYRRSNVTIVNNYYNNTNIYRNRTGVVTRNNPRTPVVERMRNNNGRQNWANNRGGFENNYQTNGRTRSVDRPIRSFNETDANNNGRVSDPNRGYSRERVTNQGDRVNREWRNPANQNRSNERIVVRPQNGEQRPETNGRVNREWRGNTPERTTPNREMQPQNREPVRRPQMETPNRGFGGNENRPSPSYETPQRRYEPSGGNRGGYDGGRVTQPQSRPSQPGGGYSPAPRPERSSGGGGGGFSPAPRPERSSGGGGGGFSPAPRSIERSGGGGGGGQISRPPSSGGRSEGRSGGGEGRSGRRG